MAGKAPPTLIERVRTEPLAGALLAAVAGTAWIAGALYCSGYEALSTGLRYWPGSLAWSAVAVLPWLALFEWSKSPAGRGVTLSMLAFALIVTGAVSLALELGLDLLTDHRMAPLGLSLLRRLPAAGVSLLLILWSRTGTRAARQIDREAEASLTSLAASVDWVEAADNYVELHMAGRVLLRRMTMRDAEQALAGRGFVRIHRRYLVNRNRIAAISGGGDLLVRLEGGVELPVGRAFAANLPRAA
jgi:hypothetical protein